MITSLLDLDLYKLTVGEIIFTYFRNVTATYRMTVRNGEAIKYWNYVHAYDYEPAVKKLATLSLKEDEAVYLRSLNLFSEEYIQFLMNEPMKGCNLTWFSQGDISNVVPQVDGLWHKTMLYEIFCLSIGNEIFARNYAQANQIPFDAVIACGMSRLNAKIRRLDNYKRRNSAKLSIVEFGTRRRLSRAWQANVVARLVETKIINATSNVLLAMQFGIPVKGTFGHEFTMGMQGVTRIQDSQSEGFILWLNHWKGKLKIALDDTLGEDKFLRDFTKELAEQYDGLRHDSGDPSDWTVSRLGMYRQYGIDPMTKTLFYSDGLDAGKIIELDSVFHNVTNLGFGVGTNFTNDTFLPVPQVVMKIIMCNGQPVAKLSNNPAKASCIDANYLTYVKHVAEKY